MAKAHAQACKSLKVCFPNLEVDVELTTIAASKAENARAAAEHYGFGSWENCWQDVIARTDIDVVSVLVPNHLHHEIVLAAAQAGKHILCEKPMAMSVTEAVEMKDAVDRGAVANMLCFNYRRTPAVLYAKEILESGRLGRPYTFRGVYLQDWLADPNIPINWRLNGTVAGSGTLGDIGSHVVDFAQFLLGDITRVQAMLRTWVAERPSPDGAGRARVDVDDEVMSMLEFGNGAIGSIQATRFAPGRKNFLGFEINCENGSIVFDYERINELNVCVFSEDDPDFKRVNVGPDHPYGKHFWPIAALGVGYHEVKMIEIYDFVHGVVRGERVRPDFADGVVNQKVLEALEVSAREQRWISVS
jgi:predicted dehydrogenase